MSALKFVQPDMFGGADEVTIVRTSKPKRKATVPKGYAARPGSGPAGETCKSCEHYVRRDWGDKYRKCGLMRAKWTRGPGSDIKARSPACAKWQEIIP